MHGEGAPHQAGRAPVLSEIYVGFNSLYKKFAMVTINNYGGYWLSESKGWEGDRWTWTDTTTEDNIWGVSEITRISDSHFRIVVKVHRQNEPLRVQEQSDCNRVAR
jgi:hypothetical protein